MNLLWVNADPSNLLDDGARLQTYYLLRELNREHPITYLAFSDPQHEDRLARAAECCTTLVLVPKPSPPARPFAICRAFAAHVASRLPAAIWACRSESMQQKLEDIVRHEHIDVVVSDSLFAAVNVPQQLPVPTILLQGNIEALSWFRRMALAPDPFRKRYFQRQWYRMYAFERSQSHRFDKVLAVSPEDLAWTTVEYGAEHASSIRVGLDLESLRPRAGARVEPGHVALVGPQDSAPYEDAASYFTTEILPRLPNPAALVQLTLVCREPTPRLQALTRVDARIHVSARTYDQRQCLERASVVVAPRRIGGGTRLEVLAAMGMQKPVVSTSIGIEGLPVHDGEHLLIADTAETFASKLAGLLENPAAARGFGDRAAVLMRSEFTWKHVAAQFAERCSQLMGGCSDRAAIRTCS